jgi:hypothetical protein
MTTLEHAIEEMTSRMRTPPVVEEKSKANLFGFDTVLELHEFLEFCAAKIHAECGTTA